MGRWTRMKSATGLCRKTMTMLKLRPDIWCMSLTRTRYFVLAAPSRFRSVSGHFVYTPKLFAGSNAFLCFSQHPSFFGITVVHLKMIILQLPCLQISGPDADKRGDPWKLEYVCGKSGHQLWRRPYQEPRWALSAASDARVCVCEWDKVVVLLELQPTLPSVLHDSRTDVSVLNCKQTLEKRGGIWVCPTTNT